MPKINSKERMRTTIRRKQARRAEIFIISAYSAAFGFGIAKPTLPKHTRKLLASTSKAMKRLKARRRSMNRIPTMYISNLAQKSLKDAKESYNVQ